MTRQSLDCFAPGKAWTVSRTQVPYSLQLLSPRAVGIAQPDRTAELCFRPVTFLEPQRLTAQAVSDTLPLYRGEHLNPPTRPQR